VTTSRRQVLLLIALIAVGFAYVYLRTPPSSVGNTGAITATSPTPANGSAVADVRLELLDRQGAPTSLDRNLFRFESRRDAEGPRTAPVRRAPVDRPTGPPPPALPPPPPPIPLRFIGYLDRAEPTMRLAVLSDGRGNVFSGKEGDIIEGRYRLLRVGTDSADLSYIDGRGQQTIRLSGQ
jgi:hypothetical protein